MIRNFTPHPIIILDKQQQQVMTFLPEKTPIRLEASTVRINPCPIGENISGIRCHDAQIAGECKQECLSPIVFSKTLFGDPQGLPKKEKNVWLIVSQLVKKAIPSRNDLVVPAEVVRNEKGQIVGCMSLGI